jgi:signal transduction histidine kinase
MPTRPPNKFLVLLKTPEIQFFLVFTIPYVGFFFINYLNFPSSYRFIGAVAFAGALVIVLMQTLYSVVAHRAIKHEENNFLSVTAHQLRTPLAAIKWTLEEIKRKTVQEEERGEMIRVAGVAAQKLSNIVESFAQVANVEDSQIEFKFTPVELVDFIDRMVAEAEPVAKQYGVSVYFERPQSAVEVLADDAKLDLALSNLINNGVKYNRRGGMVTLRIRPLVNDKQVEVTIEDTGAGIAAADKPRLFQKYFRTEDGKRINAEGTGLGLYLAKNVIEKHSGRIWVESVPGRGSSFHFTLPVVR